MKAELRPHGSHARYQQGCHCADCRGANTERCRRYRQDHGLSSMLPAEPLAELVRAAVGHSPDGLECLSLDAGVSTRTLSRILSGGQVRFYVADKVSIALGSHPALVWGMRWSV